MRAYILGTILIIFGVIFLASTAWAQVGVECHKKITPNIVSDWQLSEHSRNGIACSA